MDLPTVHIIAHKKKRPPSESRCGSEKHEKKLLQDEDLCAQARFELGAQGVDVAVVHGNAPGGPVVVRPSAMNKDATAQRGGLRCQYACLVRGFDCGAGGVVNHAVLVSNRGIDRVRIVDDERVIPLRLRPVRHVVQTLRSAIVATQDLALVQSALFATERKRDLPTIRLTCRPVESAAIVQSDQTARLPRHDQGVGVEIGRGRILSERRVGERLGAERIARGRHVAIVTEYTKCLRARRGARRCGAARRAVRTADAGELVRLVGPVVGPTGERAGAGRDQHERQQRVVHGEPPLNGGWWIREVCTPRRFFALYRAIFRVGRQMIIP